MGKRILAVFVVLLVAGGLNLLGATTTVYKAKWFGFITDSKDVRQGHKITPDAVRQSVAGGAKYALINALFFGAYLELQPADKVAPYAGQQVFVEGTLTTQSLTKGSSAAVNSISPGGGPFVVQVTTVTPHEQDGIY